MAATDQNYRNQYALDIVFAVSSAFMLGSLVWMMAEDYFRAYKVEQRIYRDVEMAIAQREALQAMPTLADFENAKAAVDKARQEREARQGSIDTIDSEIRKLLPDKERAELELANHKADLDSKNSFYDIAAEHHGVQSEQAIALKEEITSLKEQVAKSRTIVERRTQEIKKLQRDKDDIEVPLTKAIGNLKKLLDNFDRQVNLAIKKQWGIGDIVRGLPVIDGFAPPTKIEQYTINDLTIDYNFKGVTRFDRCTTCHKGIARANFNQENLTGLWFELGGENKTKLDQALKDGTISQADYQYRGGDKLRLHEAKEILKQRKTLLAGLDEGRNLPDPNQLNVSYLSDKKLTTARIMEFSAHPRLDIFVGPNSKHPAEKFGCTICHSGQPSGTDFTFAAHTPNNSKQLAKWQHEHHWESQHMWDFPMLPHRFVESSCVKCHYQVTDLYSDGNKSEAPKLLKGYNLVREFGCFGCHEINGFKGGRQIGPDMRLEPIPPLEKQSPAERAKLMADPDNPPGSLRKVGPSLYRISEKTNEEWAAKWLLSPREFRPDTKMPHYYGLANNDEHALAGTGQEKFPTTEINGVVHYLFKSSKDYVKDIATANSDAGLALKAKVSTLEAAGKDKLSDDKKKELESAKAVVALRGVALPLNQKLGEIQGNAKTGRDLFTKKGCLACHSHAVTNKEDEDWPPAPSEADFGPNLTQLRYKLLNLDVVKDAMKDAKPAPAAEKKKAATWLVSWLINPNSHSPRTRMPVTHLSDLEAADIAAWLLDQKIPRENPDDKGPPKFAEDLLGKNYASMNVPASTEQDLQNLAKVYLSRTLADYEVANFFESKLDKYRVNDLGVDEKELSSLLAAANNKEDAKKDALLHYIGKKAVGRLGCFGCHDIPGFDAAKPIGTPLAEWGKKDPARLAFDDIASYVNNHFAEKKLVVDSRVDEDGNPLSVKPGESLYERFYYDALIHKSREGFLYQKLQEPRSYDYGRLRAWDDRSRMPQFQFARTHMKPAEEQAEFNQRKQWADVTGQLFDKNQKPRPAESTELFLARKDKAAADTREAVMTFILGLVGETIPLQYVNQPAPDRLAEVKGRQVLDKYNCAGCHVIRPGVFEFKLTPGTQKSLFEAYTKNMEGGAYKDDFDFLKHRAWDQPTQRGDIAIAHGVRPLLSAAGQKARVNLILTESVHAATKLDKNPEVMLRSKDLLSLNPDDLIWPPRAALKTPDTFRAWEKEFGTEGGAFASLLSSYLKDDFYPQKAKYVEPGPFVPPLLIWQGERTQPDWLFQFLLDPHKVRELTVLRMPKFNMSEDEAKALVNYFSAVEKRFNPDVDLSYPYPKIPQRGELDNDYWRTKSAKFIDDLKKAGLYQKEADSYKPIWEKMRQDWQSESKTAAERLKAAEEKLTKLKEADKANKDDKKKDQLKKDVEAAELDKGFWAAEKKRLDELVEKKSVAKLEEDWSQKEAYALASYRLLTNQCNKCHAVGNLRAQQEEGQGPSLNLASERLRPDWAERWIAHPQRFIPYNSAMPQYFKSTDEVPLVPWLPGSPKQQAVSARDAVLNLPRILDLPLTRYWMQSGAK